MKPEGIIEMGLLLRDVILWDPEMPSPVRGDLVVEDGKISGILGVGEGDGELLLDGGGKFAVLPGFVNAHTHVAMVLLRGLGEELPLMDWLRERIWPVEARLKAEHVLNGTLLATLEMISTGTVAFGDMYFFMDQVAEGTIKSGLKANLSRGITGDDPSKLEDGLALVRNLSGRRDLVGFFGPHAPYTVPPDFLAEVGRLAVKEGAGVHTHWLETTWEDNYIREELKVDPVELLASSGLLEVKSLILAHGVWFREEHMPHLARDNVTVVHNPSSNMKLGSGFAPLRCMLENGVRVALGTDGAASNNRLDMWGELRLAALIHKGIGKDPTAISAREALRMATRNGALALGFQDVGLIREGFSADVMVVDLRGPHYMGVSEATLPEYLVYAGSSSDVHMVMVGGRVLYREGRFPHLDPEKIIQKALRSREELLKP
ncbi:cytosine deaminase-like metal-dependent hydrolase [Thermanaerovibrio velox DSM 12556]|uniref:5-methylthioadenosine/S-adenosylhomocysteine deaminase n=2 Tax=Thermanaerovibrio TaxID=81461 RepID=H0URH5_9BACT|nr:cytosine deaminase-like metal-dependent hydrolase [Thermanaerovibrio velox DSM 12556]